MTEDDRAHEALSEGGVDTAEAPDDGGLGLGVLLRRLAVGIAALLAALGVVSWLVRDPIELASRRFVDLMGLPGVFGGVLFTDTVGLTHEPLLLAGWLGGLGFWPVALVAMGASITAGVLGWSLGRIAGKAAWLGRLFERYRISAFMDRYGAMAVAVAAITPIPFAFVTWASGVARVPLLWLLLGALFRIPKVFIYFKLMLWAWALPGA